ncbi:unnamed protein product [Polarella glacialis]|uniref:4a-hydroxytetrahydrobiopterin dehydratase n=1 Tax=Polarella glacialis TaxID=89957 RepID=A0A813FQ93_POLGL|nr:unnamed protein product [Polarella glacialis]
MLCRSFLRLWSQTAAFTGFSQSSWRPRQLPPIQQIARVGALGARSSSWSRRGMSTASDLPENSVAVLVGNAGTASELRACSTGGCCGKDTPLLPLGAVLARLPELPLWRLSEDQKVISRSFVAKNWQVAIQFINDVSVIAEPEGHHPDLHLTSWRNVQIDLTTHAIGGLSLPDLVLAAKIDAIKVEYSPKWLKEQGSEAAPAAAGAGS